MPFLERFIAGFQAMPPARRIALVLIFAICAGGFAATYFWASQPEYQVLFSNLSQEDAGKIVSRLSEQRIPYQLAQGGAAILIPTDKVYETRLLLATEGLPKGGNVGFEIFDETSFSTTKFVQELNYQRALQGELSRTISQFDEVKNARVLIVPAKDTVFVETTMPATASVLLELSAPLSAGKVSGIAHLVANAVQGLGVNQVTIVDTSGKVWSKGSGEDGDAALDTNNRLEIQRNTEDRITKHIQTMLEQIVGQGKAIVRVRADMNFDQEEYSEEIFDPDSVVVRSQQKRSETSDKNASGQTAATTLSDPGAASGKAMGSKSQKLEEVTNNEINKVERRVVKNLPTITRLSVAAILDGKYETITSGKGKTEIKYIARTATELKDFEAIVQKAMGYSADREDQVTVTSIRFFTEPDVELAPALASSLWLKYLNKYGKWGLVFVLILFTFIFVVRPIMKTVAQPAPAPVEMAALPAGEKVAALTMNKGTVDIHEQGKQLANERIDKAEQLVKGWLTEA